MRSFTDEDRVIVTDVRKGRHIAMGQDHDRDHAISRSGSAIDVLCSGEAARRRLAASVMPAVRHAVEDGL